MRVFVTGATGFIGSAIVAELREAGHEVVGLVRSQASAQRLAAAGVAVRRGDLTDLDSLRAGAADSDGVIHTAFIHDFADFPAALAADRRAIDALGAALAETGRPLVIASGLGGLATGRLATEQDTGNLDSPSAVRVPAELAALAHVERGVRVSVLRLPASVHGDGDHGFVPRLIEIAREKGISGYPETGANRWPAVHRLDAARAFRLALQSAPAGSRLHAVAEEGISAREIAEVIGAQLDIPVRSIPRDDVDAHFGWIGGFFSWDLSASSAATRELLGWQPEQAELVPDLEAGHYFR
ncbi:SDR family oxidoreductase [Nocardia panacis]|uniref:SDR family oxidoreductase n=1 Tax=Nocardia panacis TaxID=2340916 RepID=A0A3A4K640_9NOCA|nr:SDR family oxidoreductase [Nocardia panacis]RJO69920.1 SDR family oxidoreductase [Nocardia panacis]